MSDLEKVIDMVNKMDQEVLNAHYWRVSGDVYECTEKFQREYIIRHYALKIKRINKKKKLLELKQISVTRIEAPIIHAPVNIVIQAPARIIHATK
jgi:hypothetical protein